MSILTDALPENLVIAGQACPIKADFRTWLKFSEIMAQQMSEAQKMTAIFKLIFGKLPPNFFDATEEILNFYRCNDRKESKKESTSPSKILFDYAYDGDLIYAAFLQQYKIDLCDTDMHWWKFKSLFNSLSDETHFIKVLQYRSADISKIKDKKQKAHYRKMKELYRLPDNRSEEQKERDFSSGMASLFGL